MLRGLTGFPNGTGVGGVGAGGGTGARTLPMTPAQLENAGVPQGRPTEGLDFIRHAACCRDCADGDALEVGDGLLGLHVLHPKLVTQDRRDHVELLAELGVQAVVAGIGVDPKLQDR